MRNINFLALGFNFNVRIVEEASCDDVNDQEASYMIFVFYMFFYF